LGYQSLYAGTGASYNIAIGYQSLYATTTGTSNSAVGFQALYNNTTGSNNVAMGYGALQSGTGASNNVAIGYYSGYNAKGGNNVFLGYNAGVGVTGGTGNVMIGYNAGYTGDRSNQLYISNSNTNTPLVWGDFSNTILAVNGSLGVGTTNPLALLSVGSSSPFQVNNLGIIGLGGSTPLFSLGVDSTDSNKFKIYAGNSITGTSQFTIDSNGVTSIANLQMGEVVFPQDAGIVSWVDMPVVSAPTNTVESYSAQLDGNPMLTIYGTSDGGGGVANLGVGIGTATPAGLFDVNGKLTVLSGGNVGIGTTNPTGLFSVGSSSHSRSARQVLSLPDHGTDQLLV